MGASEPQWRTWEVLASALSTALSLLTAAQGWVHKIFNLLPLYDSEHVRATLFSATLIIISVTALAVAIKNREEGVRKAILFGGIMVGITGVLIVDFLLRITDAYWKQAEPSMAEFIFETMLPFLFALGHAFLAAGLASSFLLLIPAKRSSG